MTADGERGEAIPGGVVVTLVYQADNPPPIPQQFVLLENGLQILLEDGNNLDLEG